MRIFTDEEGNKFELDVEKSERFAAEATYVIKPIKAVEKKAIYWIEFRKVFKRLDDKAISFSATPPQAQKVAEAIEALMEYIQHPKDYDFEEAEDYKWVARQARKAFQEDA